MRSRISLTALLQVVLFVLAGNGRVLADTGKWPESFFPNRSYLLNTLGGHGPLFSAGSHVAEWVNGYALRLWNPADWTLAFQIDRSPFNYAAFPTPRICSATAFGDAIAISVDSSPSTVTVFNTRTGVRETSFEASACRIVGSGGVIVSAGAWNGEGRSAVDGKLLYKITPKKAARISSVEAWKNWFFLLTETRDPIQYYIEKRDIHSGELIASAAMPEGVFSLVSVADGRILLESSDSYSILNTDTLQFSAEVTVGTALGYGKTLIDGQSLFVASELPYPMLQSLVQFDIKTGRLVRTFYRGWSKIESLLVSSNQLITTDETHHVRVFDLASGALLKEVKNFSPDFWVEGSDLVVRTGKPDVLNQIDLDSPDGAVSKTCPPESIGCAGLKLFKQVSSGLEHTIINVADVASGKTLFSFESPSAQLEPRYWKILPGGRLLVAVWDRSGGRKPGFFAQFDLKSGAMLSKQALCSNVEVVSADDFRLVTGGVGGELCKYDLTTNQLISRIQERKDIPITTLSLAGGEVISGGRDGVLNFRNLDSDAIIASVQTHDEYIRVMAADNERMISFGPLDGTIKVWDLLIPA